MAKSMVGFFAPPLFNLFWKFVFALFKVLINFIPFVHLFMVIVWNFCCHAISCERVVTRNIWLFLFLLVICQFWLPFPTHCKLWIMSQVILFLSSNQKCGTKYLKLQKQYVCFHERSGSSFSGSWTKGVSFILWILYILRFIICNFQFYTKLSCKFG